MGDAGRKVQRKSLALQPYPPWSRALRSPRLAILLQKGEVLRNRKLIINLLDMSFEEIAFRAVAVSSSLGNGFAAAFQPAWSDLDSISYQRKDLLMKRTMAAFLLFILSVALCSVLLSPGAADMSTTTSTENSGLLKVRLPPSRSAAIAGLRSLR